MANFTGTIITKKGLDLLAKAIQGTALVFTRVALGDGIWRLRDTSNKTRIETLIEPKILKRRG